ncbi:MAG: glycosyltransferase family 2 protein [Vampirovibrionales bacterium]
MTPTLDIHLITYNRQEYLARTLEQLFAEGSPVHRYGLTILNNASTDGSTELINEYAERYPTLLKHIVHPRNIGGNANITRAFELATAEYVWVLCDDDEFDFTHWHTVEEAMNDGADAVVVANYLNPQKNVAQLLGQMTFVPSTIYKTSIIDTTVMVNASFNIAMMFPQFAFVAPLINHNKTIRIMEHWMVRMVLHGAEETYVRGLNNDRSPFISRMFWQVGFLHALHLIHSDDIKRHVVRNLVLHGEVPCYHPEILLDDNKKAGQGSWWNVATLWVNLSFDKVLQLKLLWGLLLRCSPVRISCLTFASGHYLWRLIVNHHRRYLLWDTRIVAEWLLKKSTP